MLPSDISLYKDLLIGPNSRSTCTFSECASAYTADDVTEYANVSPNNLPYASQSEVDTVILSWHRICHAKSLKHEHEVGQRLCELKFK